MTPLQEQNPSPSPEGEVSGCAKRKPYSKPEIIVELEMEVRAGSPLSPPDFPSPPDWTRP